MLYHCLPSRQLPINFFKHFCCRMYQLTTKHSENAPPVTVCIRKVLPLSTYDVSSTIGLLNESYTLTLLFILFSCAKLFMFVDESVVYTFIHILLYMYICDIFILIVL